MEEVVPMEEELKRTHGRTSAASDVDKRQPSLVQRFPGTVEREWISKLHWYHYLRKLRFPFSEVVPGRDPNFSTIRR